MSDKGKEVLKKLATKLILKALHCKLYRKFYIRLLFIHTISFDLDSHR